VGDVLTYIKVGLAERGKRLRDLADAMGEDYGRTGKIINGYIDVPVGFDRRLREVFARWDVRRQAQESAGGAARQRGGVGCTSSGN
jgi:hypothetical protein